MGSNGGRRAAGDHAGRSGGHHPGQTGKWDKRDARCKGNGAVACAPTRRRSLESELDRQSRAAPAHRTRPVPSRSEVLKVTVAATQPMSISRYAAFDNGGYDEDRAELYLFQR